MDSASHQITTVVPDESIFAVSNTDKSNDSEPAHLSGTATSSAMNQAKNIPPNASTTLKPEENIPPSSQGTTNVKSGTDKSYHDIEKHDRYIQSLLQQQWDAARQYPELPDLAVREYPPMESHRLLFFYGSLMDSKRLRSVLNLDEEPVLRPAHIEGFRSMLWGPYPALVHSCGEIVHGQAYQISSHEEVEGQVAKLQYYETEKYQRHPVMLEFDDGTELKGYTFVWAGKKDELREGKFDLSAWQKATYGPS